MILMRLRVGSHLYGTNRPDSDEDWYEIHTEGKPKQVIQGDVDLVTIGLGYFVQQANKGVPQALEVMFAPVGWPEIDLIKDFRLGYRPNTANVINTYQRTIRSERMTKHAARLERDLQNFIKYGRFNPRGG